MVISSWTRNGAQVVAAGGSARFHCRASRPAALSWLHDAALLPAAGPTLQVRGAARAHQGVYQCVARRGAREAQAAAELRLAGLHRLLRQAHPALS